MEQGGILSCLLCNVYMDNLSLQLHGQSIYHSAGTTVEHMQKTSFCLLPMRTVSKNL